MAACRVATAQEIAAPTMIAAPGPLPRDRRNPSPEFMGVTAPHADDKNLGVHRELTWREDRQIERPVGQPQGPLHWRCITKGDSGQRGTQEVRDDNGEQAARQDKLGDEMGSADLVIRGAVAQTLRSMAPSFVHFPARGGHFGAPPNDRQEKPAGGDSL